MLGPFAVGFIAKNGPKKADLTHFSLCNCIFIIFSIHNLKFAGMLQNSFYLKIMVSLLSQEDHNGHQGPVCGAKIAQKLADFLSFSVCMHNFTILGHRDLKITHALEHSQFLKNRCLCLPQNSLVMHQGPMRGAKIAKEWQSFFVFVCVPITSPMQAIMT